MPVSMDEEPSDIEISLDSGSPVVGDLSSPANTSTEVKKKVRASHIKFFLNVDRFYS